MLWGTSSLLFSIINLYPNRGVLRERVLSLILILFASTITYLYITLNEPWIFQSAYGLMALWSMVHPSFIVADLGSRHPELKGLMKTALIWSTTSYLFGFGLWLIDNNYCVELRALRNAYPWMGPLLQFHAGWHLFTGLGGYGGCVLVQYLRRVALGQKKEIEFFYMCGIYPAIRKRKLKKK